MLIDVREAASLLNVASATIFKDRAQGKRCGPLFKIVEGQYKANRKDILEYKDHYNGLKRSYELSRGNARLKKIGVRFSDVELARLKANAGGQDLAGYIRGRVL
jgi:hypothetical protein